MPKGKGYGTARSKFVPKKNEHKRKGTIRHEAFKAEQAKLHKRKMRQVNIQYLKKARKHKFSR